MAESDKRGRKSLPARARAVAKGATAGLASMVLKVGASSRLTVGLAEAMVSRAFAREQRAVIYGQQMHRSLAQSKQCNSWFLRRSIHRIEKGLSMAKRKPVFAEDFIGQTVDEFAKAVAVPETDPSELAWARDVLSAYFGVVQDTPRVAAARTAFAAHASAQPKLIPTTRDLVPECRVGWDDFMALSRRRRSIRRYQDRNVPRDLVDQALLAGLQAPSACNRQPFHFRIYDDPGLVEQIMQIPVGATGFSSQIPMVAVLTGLLRAYAHERDRHVIYIDASLAAMGFMLALETVGLSSCPVNFPDIEDRERRMASLLRLAPDERPVMLITIGWPSPDALIPCSQKRDVEHARSWNRCS